MKHLLQALISSLALFPINYLSFLLSTEEILRSNTALWFSPDGRRLLYINFNDSTVEEQSYQWYGTIEDSNAHLYPTIKKVRYPKVSKDVRRHFASYFYLPRSILHLQCPCLQAGTNNPIATLYIADFFEPSNIKIHRLVPPIEFSNTL